MEGRNSFKDINVANDSRLCRVNDVRLAIDIAGCLESFYLFFVVNSNDGFIYFTSSFVCFLLNCFGRVL